MLVWSCVLRLRTFFVSLQFLIYFHFECSMNYFKITSSLKICILDSGMDSIVCVCYISCIRNNTQYTNVLFFDRIYLHTHSNTLHFVNLHRNCCACAFRCVAFAKFSLKLLTSFSVGFIRWHVCCFVPCETSAIIIAIDRWFWIVFRHCIICNCFGSVWFGLVRLNIYVHFICIRNFWFIWSMWDLACYCCNCVRVLVPSIYSTSIRCFRRISPLICVRVVPFQCSLFDFYSLSGSVCHVLLVWLVYLSVCLFNAENVQHLRAW